MIIMIIRLAAAAAAAAAVPLTAAAAVPRGFQGVRYSVYYSPAHMARERATAVSADGFQKARA